MKITKNQLRKIIKEESVRLLKEEGADCIKDYIAMGYSRAEAYKECDAYGEEDSGYQRSTRKTTHVGADANEDKVVAIETALLKKPNNFLKSILTQLKNGRGLSGKQTSIVKSILRKSDPEAAKMFESSDKMKITKRQLQIIIKEATANVIKEQDEEKISSTDFVKAMKEDLPSMMKLVPDAMNDELMNAIRALVAASKYDTSAFKAAIGIVMSKTEKAQEKVKEQN
jgi:hypothetical protein|tara:strand:+ start:473 stop:1153 length:681 start_codon:yes stop_codon:yes gene_type:complete